MRKFTSFLTAAILGLPFLASAHEVYVLDKNEIARGLIASRPDFLMAIKGNVGEFVTWGILAVFAVMGAFFFSVSRPMERVFEKPLQRLKKFAPHIAQITLGLSLVISGVMASAFGPELPMAEAFGPSYLLMRLLFVILGACILFGIYPRLSALGASMLFAVLLFRYGIYMFNYATYFGEAFALGILGAGYINFSKGAELILPQGAKAEEAAEEVKFLILRVVFGSSLIFASIYAKFIYGDLALQTVLKYRLYDYFRFQPEFIVLGAMILEILIGLFIMVGFEVRFASLFLLLFLGISLNFFGEAVWPHIILIGTAVAIFTHGYDRFCLSGRFRKSKSLEPVL